MSRAGCTAARSSYANLLAIDSQHSVRPNEEVGRTSVYGHLRLVWIDASTQRPALASPDNAKERQPRHTAARAHHPLTGEASDRFRQSPLPEPPYFRTFVGSKVGAPCVHDTAP
jgi:hypothetical protein